MTVTKWIFCCLIAVIALSSCKAEIEGDPDRFKKGIFEIPASESFGKTTIIRKDSFNPSYFVEPLTLKLQLKPQF